jgi:hypothetical protein
MHRWTGGENDQQDVLGVARALAWNKDFGTLRQAIL